MVRCLLSLAPHASTSTAEGVATWQRPATCVTLAAMSHSPLDQAFDRAERALLRIERSVERGAMHRGRDDALRGKVAAVVAELDALIRDAGAPR